MCYQEGLYGHYFTRLCLFGKTTSVGVTTNESNYSQFPRMIKQIQIRLIAAGYTPAIS
jgi:hypothetical protein